MAIKPIETKYGGCHFRSRLEARWAVFFDELGLEWEYEPEGFEFDGIRYLPDFYLPDLEIWCEIKGKLKTETFHSYLFGCECTSYPELRTADKFRDESNPILVIVGPPWKNHMEFYAFDFCDSGGGTYDNRDDCAWIIVDKKPALRVTWRDDRKIYSDLECQHELTRVGYFDVPDGDYIKVVNAIRKAKEARFEFGE